MVQFFLLPPSPGFSEFFISKMSISHPRANKESQFPTPETTFTKDYCTQTRYKLKFYKSRCQPSNSLKQDAFFLPCTGNAISDHGHMIDIIKYRKKEISGVQVDLQ
jgi:hypothetical protein